MFHHHLLRQLHHLQHHQRRQLHHLQHHQRRQLNHLQHHQHRQLHHHLRRQLHYLHYHRPNCSLRHYPGHRQHQIFFELSDCEVYNEADLCEEVEVGSVENCSNINELKKLLITTKTVKGKPKLCYGGYYYTVDRVGKNEKIQWKCERVCNTQDHARCNGRASSYGYFEPVEIITEHNHIPEPERTAGLLALEEMLQRAKISSDNPRTIMKKSQLQVPTESIFVSSGEYTTMN